MRLRLAALGAVAGAALLANPAFAFDCGRAATRAEKAICADKDLKAADDALAASYDAVLKRTPARHLEMLKSSQRAWLKSRDEDCQGEVPDVERADEFASCLLDRTTARTEILSPKPLAGPGLSTPLTPIFVWREETLAKAAIDIAVYEFGTAAGTPGMRAFDAQVDAVLAKLESEYGAGDGDPNYGSYYNGVAVIWWASDEILNVDLPIETFSGGAHPNVTAIAITVDLRRGKILSWSDVFPPAAQKPLADACYAAIQESSGRTDEVMKDYAGAIAKGVTEFERWTITAEGATVSFAPYDIGPYAEGEHQCDLDKDLLNAAAGGKGWIVK